MQYFSYLSDKEQQELFYLKPRKFNKEMSKEKLAFSLGATLYMPATKESISFDILTKKFPGLMSMVLCLEDAIGDNQIEEAERMLGLHINNIYEHIKHENISQEELPMIFVRVRDVAQLGRLARNLGSKLKVLTGFVFPKVTTETAEAYFHLLQTTNSQYNLALYGMPILESAQIIYKETRLSSLLKLKEIFKKYEHLVLNIRIGATDFSSYFGLRRPRDMSIYDIGVIRDCIVDFINIFSRDQEQFVISGPVWEYFNKKSGQMDESYDGFINEIRLDRANGLIGKTTIHPSQIRPVQALYVVSHEEYLDAKNILEHNKGQLGVMKSQYQNKMNEIKPHLNWAQKIINLAEVYGVYQDDKNYKHLLSTESYLHNFGQAKSGYTHQTKRIQHTGGNTIRHGR